ncbi:hypothetical protein [Streptomyces sp. Isolate_219]|uniref:hypothetical protein n=1 Tax=Streptomyces sp. Isolate_219 TaxID=2950110 RepID=UPI0021C77066|nr:hypothetical protein [Streptomyces sp. Isolate_219]MCR8576142.1 hypothetical protein [Streptomyces sp. Isolate_219]
MRDFTVRFFGRIALALTPGPNPRASLLKWAERVFPARGRHRATPTPAPTPSPSPRPLRPLPEHKSPYAQDAAEKRPFLDTLNPVRPYVLNAPKKRPDDPVREAQAVRRWALDMALRGIDVGPTTIHGVHVRPGNRTLRVAVPA